MKGNEASLTRSNVRRHATQWGVSYDEAWDRLAAESGLVHADGVPMSQAQRGQFAEPAEPPGPAVRPSDLAILDDDDASQP